MVRHEVDIAVVVEEEDKVNLIVVEVEVDVDEDIEEIIIKIHKSLLVNVMIVECLVIRNLNVRICPDDRNKQENKQQRKIKVQ